MPTVILQKDSSILRARAEEVPVSDITKPRVRKVLADMRKALAKESDGVALAAPQIGVPLRMFIVSAAALGMPPELAQQNGRAGPRELEKGGGFLTFINPRITKLSRERAVLDEGCLSVRPLWGKIKRAKKATVTAYDEAGRKITRGASGLLAQIFQHETDHLDGILFTDKAANLREIPSGRSAPPGK